MKFNAVEIWEHYMLPVDLSGKTFLDVGCGDGQYLEQAVTRNSKYALGIDIKRHPRLSNKLNFTKVDVDRSDCPDFMELPEFDIVLCKTVLPYIKSPVSLLLKLRSKTGNKLIVDTYMPKKIQRYPSILHTPEAIKKILTGLGPDTLIEVEGKGSRFTRMFCATFN